MTIIPRSISFYMGKLDTSFFRREEKKLSKVRMKFAFPSAALLALNLLGLLSLCESVLPSYLPMPSKIEGNLVSLHWNVRTSYSSVIISVAVAPLN